MKRTKINQLNGYDTSPGKVLVKGWVRTRRDAKGFSFMEINDGSCLSNIQVVANNYLSNYTDIQGITTGSAVAVAGDLVTSPGKGQKWEIQAAHVDIISLAPETYPLQKKRHSDEFLRTIAHLRPRTNKYGAAFRIRSEMVHAIHRFYKEKGFFYLTSPVITGSDCEGAGEMFRVTSLDPAAVIKQGKMEFSRDFFGRESNLTVSGQLSAEMFALALGDVYTFGPTFRAENSNTSRHVAEFWMLEPEMAFCDLSGNMDHGEELVQYLVNDALTNCTDDMNLFSRFVDKTLAQRLDTLVSKTFERISYTEAIAILEKSHKKFEYEVRYGIDLQSEHERFLAEEYVQKPIFLFDYPVPGIGELIGGSQREERLDVLQARMAQMGLPEEPYWWYLDSRRYGSVPHSGFGMGFERFLMMITGITNIRDVIPFPRTPGSIDF
ncbi:MAG: asparagine--tRNA ligase [Desulfobacteraceae bacterium]|nr:asparagine--tRNA ligase [Desulfobacteraceae bacterium]